MRIQRSLVTLLLFSCAATVLAFDFHDPDTGIEVLLDMSMRSRIENIDQELVSPAHGGQRVSAGRSGNLDDGTLNYEKGELVSNMFRSNAELTLSWLIFGLVVRGYGFYGYANENNDWQRTGLTSEVICNHFSGQKFLFTKEVQHGKNKEA